MKDPAATIDPQWVIDTNIDQKAAERPNLDPLCVATTTLQPTSTVR